MGLVSPRGVTRGVFAERVARLLPLFGLLFFFGLLLSFPDPGIVPPLNASTHTMKRQRVRDNRTKGREVTLVSCVTVKTLGGIGEVRKFQPQTTKRWVSLGQTTMTHITTTVRDMRKHLICSND